MSKHPFLPVEFVAKYGTAGRYDEMNNDLNQVIDGRVAQLKAEASELARQLARLQRELDNETLRRKSAESGMAQMIKDYTAVIERLNKYERTVA